MNRVYFKRLILVSLLCFCSFACAFNANGWGKGEISFVLPSSNLSNSTGRAGILIGNEPVNELPETYAVKIIYDDGSVVYFKEHKAGDNVEVPKLSAGQYTVSIRGETTDFIFIGESAANVLEEEVCNVSIKIQRWKKGLIKLDFSLLDKSIKSFSSPGALPEFTVSIFDSADKVAYSGKIDYNTLDSEKCFLIDKTLPVGDYTVKLTGGNPDWAYRVNKDLKISVSEGKIFRCYVRDHESINYFISSNGSDESGTGESSSPFRTLSHVANLVKDIHIPVRITIADNVVDNNVITFANSRGDVTIESKAGSTLSAKAGINVTVGKVVLEKGVVISGGNKVTLGSDGVVVLKDNARFAEDTVVLVQPGATLRIGSNLTSEVAAYIQMANPVNKTPVIDIDNVGLDVLAANAGKFKIASGQSYYVKEDGKAWAVIPDGYDGIDDALASLNAGTASNLKVFVDDYTELNSLGSSLRSTSTSNVALVLKTNPQVSEIQEAVFKGNAKISSIVIPATIKKICNNAFNGCGGLGALSFEGNGDAGGVAEIGSSAFAGSGLTGKLVLPASLRTIGDSAFAGCGLDDVEFNEGLTVIGGSAFKGALTKANAVLTFPASLTTIGDSAFEICTTTTGVIFKESLVTIGNNAFRGDTALTGILTMPESLRTIGNNAFENSHIVGLKLNKGLTTMGNAAFKGCTELAGEVTIPGSLKKINEEAFFGCTSLGNVVVENGIDTIFNKAFENSGITSVELPNSIGSLRSSAFAGCTKLTSVTVPNYVWGIYDNVFNGCTALSSVTLNENLSSIGAAAFNSCSSLSNITIPASVISIDNGAFTGSGVTTVTFKDLSSKWDKYSGGVFAPDSSGHVNVGELTDGASRPLNVAEAASRLGNGGNNILKVFVGTKEDIIELSKHIKNTPGGSVTIDLRTPLKSIPAAAFANCIYLKSIKLPEGMEGIGQMAFANDSGLTEVTLPNSLKAISRNAFAGCRNLSTVNMTLRNWNVNNIFTNDSKTISISQDVICGYLNNTYVQYDWSL